MPVLANLKARGLVCFSHTPLEPGRMPAIKFTVSTGYMGLAFFYMIWKRLFKKKNSKEKWFKINYLA